jgi:hypothetical protein
VEFFFTEKWEHTALSKFKKTQISHAGKKTDREEKAEKLKELGLLYKGSKIQNALEELKTFPRKGKKYVRYIERKDDRQMFVQNTWITPKN